jgi:gluconolactonase
MALLDNTTQVSLFVGAFGSGLDHPECVSCGLDGYAYAGGEAGQVYRIDVERRTFAHFASAPGFVGGIAQDGRGNLYACSAGGVQRVKPDGQVSPYATGLQTPNYPTFDGNGNLYVSDSGGWKTDDGKLCKIRPGGKVEVWNARLKEFPNGLALSPDGEYLYVAMSLNPPRVCRVKIQASGSAGAIEALVQLPQTVPDGLAFDTRGNLYISCYRPDRVYCLAPDGGLDILAEDYEGTVMAAPTNIAFCGKDRDVLLGANLGRWHITRYDVDAVGVPLHYPQID